VNEYEQNQRKNANGLSIFDLPEPLEPITVRIFAILVSLTSVSYEENEEFSFKVRSTKVSSLNE
jgi:hypothetical protein